MCAQTATQENSSLAVTPPNQPRKPWRVASVEVMPDFKLHVRFVDGTQGTVNLSAMIHSPDAGVFSALTDPALFEQVFVEYGAVTWPDEIDLAPDAMYAEIKKTGVWVLR